ncbi:MAG TPA: hypothetical protein VGJ84_18215, partial [Polyangiaceae bacterium]
GRATLQASAVPQPSELVVRGELRDEAGAPIAAARVALQVLESRQGPIRPLPIPETCPPTQNVHYARGFARQPNEYGLDTSEQGGFCVRIREPEIGKVVRLSFHDEQGLYEPQQLFLEVDPTRYSLELYFPNEPVPLLLDRASHAVMVETRVTPPLKADESSQNIELELWFTGRGESERRLAVASVRPGERAEFKILSSQLGRPGPGILTVRYSGSKSIRPAERSVSAPRTARVFLSVGDGPELRIEHGESPELYVTVRSLAGTVSSGSVEARNLEETVGIAPVQAGTASINLQLHRTAFDHARVRLTYLPQDPSWLAAAPIYVNARVVRRSAWRRAPWIASAVLIALWMIRAWRRPPRTERATARSETPITETPELQVIRSGPADSGWRGRVVDAHDEMAIQGARLQITVGAEVTHAVTDVNGRFELVAHSTPDLETSNAWLEVEAPLHAALRKPAPPTGELRIALVSHRRALLARLIDWAHRRGRPWARPPETTPGHVARVAQRRDAGGIAAWAESVESAAFGPEPPDENRARAIEAGAPAQGLNPSGKD